jgi:hypothetical protein
MPCSSDWFSFPITLPIDNFYDLLNYGLTKMTDQPMVSHNSQATIVLSRDSLLKIAIPGEAFMRAEQFLVTAGRPVYVIPAD